MKLKWRQYFSTSVGGLIAALCAGSALGQAAVPLKGVAATRATAADIALMKSQAFPLVKNRSGECTYEGGQSEDQITVLTGGFTRANSKQKLMSAYYCGSLGFDQHVLAVFENDKLAKVAISHYGGDVARANDLNKNGTNEILVSGGGGGAGAYYEHMTILDLFDTKPQSYGVYLTLNESCQWVGKDAKFSDVSYELQVKPGATPTFFATTQSTSCANNKTTVTASKAAIRWMDPKFEFLKMPAVNAVNPSQTTKAAVEPAKTPDIISIKYWDFKVSIQRCEAITSIASNTKCVLKFENTTDELRTLGFDTSGIKLINPGNIIFGLDNLAFSGRMLNESSTADVLPRASLELDIRATLPKDTKFIGQILLNEGGYISSVGTLSNIPILGRLDDLSPFIIPQEKFKNYGIKARLRSCIAVELVGTNMQCRMTLINLSSEIKSVYLNSNQFSFVDAIAVARIANNVSSDNITFHLQDTVKIVPLGSIELYINFFVPIEIKRLSRIAYNFSGFGGISANGVFSEINIEGVVKPFMPKNSLAGGVYSSALEIGRFYLQSCEVISSSEVAVCKLVLVNYDSKIMSFKFPANQFNGLSQNSKEYTGSLIRTEAATFEETLNVKVAPNSAINIEVNFKIPEGTTRLSTASLPAYNSNFKDFSAGNSQLREIPLLRNP